MCDTGTGREKHVSGTLLTNGRARNTSEFRRQSVYIAQQDALLEELSVSEALHYSAALKLPAIVGAGGRERRIAHVLDFMGIAGARDTRTSRLSGGERKRLGTCARPLALPYCIASTRRTGTHSFEHIYFRFPSVYS